MCKHANLMLLVPHRQYQSIPTAAATNVPGEHKVIAAECDSTNPCHDDIEKWPPTQIESPTPQCGRLLLLLLLPADHH
jgi:hypothetical protein